MFPGHGGTGRQDAALAGIPPAEILDVSASLAPLGPPEPARAAYRRAEAELDRYPSIDARPLREAYAAAAGVGAENVLAGNGSTEFVYLLSRALRPVKVWSFVPTYSDYADAARVAGIPYERLPTSAESGFARHLGAAEQRLAAGEMLVVCNPNNPTGTYISVRTLVSFARRHPEILLVVDEAYADFIGPDASCLKECREEGFPENLVLLQSPTKFFCLPGLRLGYCLGHASVVARLLDAKEPWTVGAAGLAVGEALLSCTEHAAEVRRLVASGRDHLQAELTRQTPLQVFPTQANFFLCRLPDETPTAGEVREGCLEQGVVLRDCTNFDGLDSRYLRLAVRTPAENDRLVRALAAVLRA